MSLISKEGTHLGIAGAETHYLVVILEHPTQAVGTALFVFYNQYLHRSMGISGMVTQYSS